MKISFRGYILGIIIVVSFLLIILINPLIFIAAENEIRKEKLRDYETAMKTIKYYLDRFIDEKYRDIDFISTYLNQNEQSNLHKQEIDKFLSLKPEIKYVLFVDKNRIVKKIIPYKADIIGIDLSNNPITQEEVKQKFYGPHVSIIDKKPHYIISKSMNDGTILALINIPGINSLIETLKLQGYYAFIVDNKGLALAHVNEEIVNQGLNLSQYNFIREGINGVESLIEGEFEGEKYIFLARKIPSTNYTLFVGNLYDEAFGSLFSLRERLLLIIVSIIFCGIFVSLIISKRFVKPVENIILMTDQIKRGEFKVTKFKSDVEELEEISLAISEMAEKIKDRETKLRKIFEASKDGIIITKIDGEGLDFNESALRMFGYKEGEEVPQHLRVDSYYYNDISDREIILNELKNKGSIENFEVVFKKRDGSIFYGLLSSTLVKDDNGEPLFIVSTIKDITEKRKLQEQLFQAQKMESIGRLAGSIAHDFNNILSLIHGSNQLIQMHLKNDPQIEKYTSNITQGVEKARDFIRKLLSFSKRQPLIQKIYDLNEIIKEEMKLLSPTIREDITVELKTTDYPLLVNLDRTQFTQIILNLTINAIDAMPEGGKIIISTQEKTFDYENIKGYPLVREGKFACIIFSDTGTGISEEIKDRIFEPFFTTKAEGTGLGLATVYSIVQQHNGFINVYSEQGNGATFKIYLPLASSTQKFIDEKEENNHINIKRILLVEDNDEVRSVVEEILKTNGFEVYSFSNGLDVINQFDSLKDKIELCLFDIIMPSIGGFELYKKIKEIKPDIKVLFMTGYADNLLQIKTLIKEGQQIINKPFGIAELKRKIKEMSDLILTMTN